ncbi:hypothetical protein BH18VER2_BH18VER2_06230 [soil metagenome]
MDFAAVQKLDVCSLLKAEEVAAVQGSPVRQTKSSTLADGKFLIRQCFYETVDFNQSVNLTLTVPDPNASTQLSPAAFWKEKFAPYQTGAVAREAGEKSREPRGEEEGERRDPPKKIEGIGDEAFWMGPDALYVLRGDVYLRVSLGGADSAETKIKKAITLMKPAVARLSSSGSLP